MLKLASLLNSLKNRKKTENQLRCMLQKMVIEARVNEATIRNKDAKISKLIEGLVSFREYFKSTHESGYTLEDIDALKNVRNTLLEVKK